MRLRPFFTLTVSTLLASSATAGFAACSSTPSGDGTDAATATEVSSDTARADNELPPPPPPPPPPSDAQSDAPVDARGDARRDGGPEDFTAQVCSPADLLTGLAPAQPFDYLELRETLYQSIDGGFVPSSSTALASTGAPCSATADPAACNAALAAALAAFPTPIFPDVGGFRLPNARYLVVRRGGNVQVVATRADLLSFLGKIDSPADARLLVRADGYQPLCGKDSTRAVPGGYEVVAKREKQPCINQYEGFVLSVTEAGVVTQKSRVDLTDPDAGCAVPGRRPEGLLPRKGAPGEEAVARWIATMAHLEAASVPAFERLALELGAHGAPLSLVREAERAAQDEIRHTRLFTGLASKHGARLEAPVCADVDQAPRSLEAIAIENAVEGCVRETFGALLAEWQGRTALDGDLRSASREVAVDEARHAELAWAVARWVDGLLDDEARARVSLARDAAVDELRLALAETPSAALITSAGLPDAPHARALLDACATALWAA